MALLHAGDRICASCGGMNNRHQPTCIAEEFVEVISVYTRRQAIEDGVLVDCEQTPMGEMRRQLLKWPLAMTTTAFHRYVWPIVEDANLPAGQSLEVRFFHEKAAPVNLDTFLGRSSRNADRRPTGGAKVLASLPLIKVLIAESPRFHPHSWWSCLPRCQLVSSIANGCCHLGTELNYLCLQKVYVPNRTRSHPNSTICHQPYL